MIGNNDGLPRPHPTADRRVSIVLADCQSRCRLCILRNPIGTKMYRVTVRTRRVTRRCYCDFCFTYLCERASEKVPELKEMVSDVSSDLLAEYLGVQEAPIPMTKIDLDVSSDLLTHDELFRTFWPEGEELESHRQRARERLGG